MESQPPPGTGGSTEAVAAEREVAVSPTAPARTEGSAPWNGHGNGHAPAPRREWLLQLPTVAPTRRWPAIAALPTLSVAAPGQDGAPAVDALASEPVATAAPAPAPAPVPGTPRPGGAAQVRRAAPHAASTQRGPAQLAAPVPVPAAPARWAAPEVPPAPARTREPAAKPWTRATLEWIAIVASAMVAALVIKALLLQAFVIPSVSMEPTLDVGDRVLVFKLAPRLEGVDRGDVVVFDRPGALRDGRDDSDLIKRVIGLSGEIVEGSGGHVFVDGVQLDEPWLAEGVRTSDFPPTRIPDGAIWVMGDNRGNSRDSRVFGPLDEDDVVGQAFLRWWPVGRLSGL